MSEERKDYLSKHVDIKLEEIAEHFKNQLFEGNFTFEKCDQYHCTIDIDGYKFRLWIANDPKENFRFWSYDQWTSNPLLPHLEFKTQEKRIKAYQQVEPLIQNEKKRLLKEKKQKELERLQREVKNLEKDVYKDESEL